MLQIIKEYREPSISDRFSQAFANIGQGLGQVAPQLLMQKEQKKIASSQMQKENEAFAKMGLDLSGIQDPNLRKSMVNEFAKSMSKKNFLDSLRSLPKDIKDEGEFQEEKIRKTQEPTSEQDWYNNLSDEQRAELAVLDPNASRALESIRTNKVSQDIARNKEVSTSYSENKDYINKVYDQYEDSLRKDAILDRMDQLNESEEISDSGVINLLNTLGLSEEILKNPANEEYTKLALDLLGGGSLQADYGSRVLQSEFKVSLQRIPTLKLTKEGRRQIAENIKTMLLPSKLKKERLQFYLDRQEKTGKPLPHDLRGKILRDIKPQLEEAYDKFKQRNGRYQVREGTYPDDNVLEKYYFLSGKNSVKARKMMEEDGYDIDGND